MKRPFLAAGMVESPTARCGGSISRLGSFGGGLCGRAAVVRRRCLEASSWKALSYGSGSGTGTLVICLRFLSVRTLVRGLSVLRFLGEVVEVGRRLRGVLMVWRSSSCWLVVSMMVGVRGIVMVAVR